MDTLLKWSRNFSGMESRHVLERNYDKLVEIVQAVEYCIGLEFDEDIRFFQLKNGRTPKPHEEPFIHPPFHSYDEERKNKLIQCRTSARRVGEREAIPLNATYDLS
jgi:hypothetical protein